MSSDPDIIAQADIDPEMAWAAVLRRDRSYDGKFVAGVLSTGIYCRPSCAARHPARANVRFFAGGAAAREAGLRACKRCLPDDVARDEEAVALALEILNGEAPPRLAELAKRVGYTPSHFQRLFKRHVGITPAAYARGGRLQRATEALESNDRVTDAIYDAGYNTPSRFYAETKGRLGMTPSAWKNGGEGAVIRYIVADTSLGSVLIAATQKGICRLSFDEGEEDLRARFPKAAIERGDATMDAIFKGALSAVESPASMPDLPIDVSGTAFQEAVWQALRQIPAGETRSYAEVAAAAGKPKAVRAAGSANGANNVAVLIPCHRIIRSDGSIGGYAYGLERKQALLAREKDTRS